MADDKVTLVGNIGQEPEHRTTAQGEVLNFSVAVNERSRTADGTWSDGPTSWYRVAAWDDLGRHAAASLHKGDRVIVQGRMRVSDYTSRDGTTTRTTEVKAFAVGHDLSKGTAVFTRAASRAAAPPASEPAPALQLVPAGAGGAQAATEASWAAPMTASPEVDDVPF